MYDVEWQALRVSLLKTNSNDGWMTERGVETNLTKLQRYLVEAESQDEYRRRCYRVRNCLTATSMGYGERYPGLRARTEKARDAVPAPGVVQASPDHWTEVRKELEELDPTVFSMIRRDLKGRARNTTELARPELFRFLDLMNEVRLK